MREKSFSEIQKKKKESLMKKNGFVILENIKGDIIVKNPKKIFVELNGIEENERISIEDLVTIHDCSYLLFGSKEFNLMRRLCEIK